MKWQLADHCDDTWPGAFKFIMQLFRIFQKTVPAKLAPYGTRHSWTSRFAHMLIAAA